MGAGAVVLNQPGVYLVDVDGNAITVTDGLAIGSAEAMLIAGKDGSTARFIKVASDGTVRIDPSGTTTQPISAASLPLPAGAATSALQTQPGVDIGDVTINNAAGAAAVNIQDGGNSITIDATSLPLPTGAATETTLATRASEASLVAQSIVDNAAFTDGTTRIVPAGFIFDETAGTAFVENDAGAARIDDKRAQVLVVEDFSVRGRRLVITATNAAKVDGSAVTQPISAVSLPLPAGAATETTLATRATEATVALIKTNTDNLDVALSTRLAESTFTSRINTLGQKAMAASTPIAIASDQTVIPVSDNGGSLTVDSPQMPAALVGGRFDGNIGSWFGSTVPTVGQKSMAQSIPVCMPADQTAVLVTFTGTRTGVVGSIITLGGGTANTLQIMRATTYTEPTSAAQRSIGSSNANDTAAGTGARTVEVVYYDNTGGGPFTETVTLNGTTPVNTVATDIRFIESMAVTSAGSGGANVGTISLFGSTGGAGGTVGTIGVGSILASTGDNRTLWAHHYVAAGFTASMSTLVVGAQSGGSGTSARFLVRSTSVLVSAPVDVLVGDVLLVQGAFSRLFNFYPTVIGFARLTAYAIPSVNNAVLSAAFDFSEVAT